MSESILAWHFVGDTLRDGKPVPKDGEWLEYWGPLRMCESGLHASIHPFDALRYAPGPILCRVECSGEMIHDSDKLVCSHRKIIKRMDATEGLRYFAMMQALSVAHLWDCPDVILEFLMTGNNAQDAQAAAWDAWAAQDAAWAAARDAQAVWAAAWAAQDAWAARDEWRALVHEAFEIMGDE